MKIVYYMRLIVIIVTIFFSINNLIAQSFTRIQDQSNPIVTDTPVKGYPGCSFIDYNNDGLQDLFVNYENLYKNEGDGKFSKVSEFKGQTQPIVPGQIIGSGNSWADYNNDGSLDMFFASAKSFLFWNNGSGVFTKITSGEMGDSTGNRGWACAWGDYDNDGNVDLIITHPAGFVPGNAQPCHLLHNDGAPGYSFSEIKDFEFTNKLAPYTVATWSDFDQDGDIDLFIGSGPVNGTPARDYLYKNMLKENGTAGFERIDTSPIGTDLQDGQVWNWIDYDNDGDLDAFLTNYRSAPNRFYRNDNGTFHTITTGMELNSQGGLANTWGDFDNDGFPDVIITSETKNHFFHNNGDGTFTDTANDISLTGAERGATIGDYDNDGNLDVFIAGFPGANGLYHNENTNGYHWKELKLIGSSSNRAAIGAMVHLKAIINGIPMWQLREVSAQNSFNSQNSLIVHFGLRDASVIDSLVVNWPSGTKQVLNNLNTNDIQNIIETPSTGVSDDKLNKKSFNLDQNYPDPFNPSTTIGYSISKEEHAVLKIFDLLGNEVTSLVDEKKTAGHHQIIFNAAGLTSGVYFYTFIAGGYTETKKLILMK